MTRQPRSLIRIVAITVLCLGPVATQADVSESVPKVTFQFDRKGLPVPRYSLTVAENGSAVYEGQESALLPGDSRPADAPAPLEDFRRTTTLSPGTTRSIFAMTGTLKDFHVPCAGHAKNVADMGAKTLRYQGPEGSGECSYNYSENKTVVQLTGLFQGIAEMMDQGRRLDHLHRYDRLGLDEAITNLAEEVNAGRAVDVATIAPTLRSIAGDPNVMERVRLKASQLLSLLPPEVTSVQR